MRSIRHGSAQAVLITYGNLGVELVVATVVNSGNTESEAGGDIDTESQAAVLSVRADGNARTGLSIVFAEADGDGSLLG